MNLNDSLSLSAQRNDDDIFLPIKFRRAELANVRIESINLSLHHKRFVIPRMRRNHHRPQPFSTLQFAVGGREIRAGVGDNQSLDLRSLRRSNTGEEGEELSRFLTMEVIDHFKSKCALFPFFAMKQLCIVEITNEFRMSVLRSR